MTQAEQVCRDLTRLGQQHLPEIIGKLKPKKRYGLYLFPDGSTLRRVDCRIFEAGQFVAKKFWIAP